MSSRPAPRVFSPHPPAYTPPSQIEPEGNADGPATVAAEQSIASQHDSTYHLNPAPSDRYAAVAAGALETGVMQSPIPPPATGAVGAAASVSAGDVQQQYQAMMAAYGMS